MFHSQCLHFDCGSFNGGSGTQSSMVRIRFARIGRSAIARDENFMSHEPLSPKRELIDLVLPILQFERIPLLFFIEGEEELKEFSSQTGLSISTHFIGVTLVAGNRVANTSEIWLHPDGTLHEYLEASTWESYEWGCIQRHYVGPASEDKIWLNDLEQQIAFNLAPDRDDDDYD
jgi:hypothetical protein